MIRAWARNVRVAHFRARAFSTLDDALLYMSGGRQSNATKVCRDLPQTSAASTASTASAASISVTVRAETTPSLLATARAAGTMGAKQASSIIPMLLPKTLDAIFFEFEQEAMLDEEPSLPETPVEQAPSSPPRSLERGGFSAESLLDPDAWLEAHQEAVPLPAEPTPSPTPSSSARQLQIHCRVSASNPAHTEALAGCMAAALSLVDSLGTEVVQIGHVQVS